jgi:hypothetical protein
MLEQHPAKLAKDENVNDINGDGVFAAYGRPTAVAVTSVPR